MSEVRCPGLGARITARSRRPGPSGSARPSWTLGLLQKQVAVQIGTDNTTRPVQGTCSGLVEGRLTCGVHFGRERNTKNRRRTGMLTPTREKDQLLWGRINKRKAQALRLANRISMVARRRSRIRVPTPSPYVMSSGPTTCSSRVAPRRRPASRVSSGTASMRARATYSAS